MLKRTDESVAADLRRVPKYYWVIGVPLAIAAAVLIAWIAARFSY